MSCGYPLTWQPLVDGVKLDRGTSLRIGDVHIAHRGRNHAVTEDLLHLGQMHTGPKQVRSTGMTKLMKAVHRDLRTARYLVNTVADRKNSTSAPASRPSSAI